MSKDKEKELKYLIYIKSMLIKEAKKEIKQYRDELENLYKDKGLSRRREKR